MDLNKDNQLKFANDSTTTVIIAGRQKDDFDGEVVTIEPLPDGYDHFKPSKGLLNKLKDENADIGDTIQIKKIADPKYPHPYFNVEILNKAPLKQQSEPLKQQSEPIEDKGIKNFEKQFEEPNKNLSIHEFSLRLIDLEKKVALLLSDAGHKPGDENIPF